MSLPLVQYGMPAPIEGYVLHTYGAEKYVRHAVASVVSLRRYDAERPVALYCPPKHQALLERHGLDTLFQHIGLLPEAHRSIVGFKLHLPRFTPFDRSLFIDSDIIWCRNPDPLWQQLAAYPVTATGLERADFFFGGPKGFGVIADALLDRRRRTMRRFGLTHLPRVQAGLLYVQDLELAEQMTAQAAHFLSRHAETHFRSRLAEGRSEESCEWSLAMAMSRLGLPVFPWFQGANSPQLDFIEGLTTYDDDFHRVVCRYYCDPFVYSLRGLANARWRDLLIGLFSSLPGRGDYIDVTPYALHFGWLRHKEPFYDFAARTWNRLLAQQRSQPVLSQVS